ncbi:MAG TPA: sigma-54 dependent transcriptional regulator [Bryobacteraceae bacterium]|nr:sigma-54 dependent transcriptional regulator [Bryobacteraceae bacterium]
MHTPALLEKPRVLIGRSPKVQLVLQQIEKMSSSRWPVLILGETGTGKELIAKTVHNRSAPGPFVVVDCSSLVGPLMESELFGHMKGAFTGAANAKMGLIEMANGGTAFFDEIGELPLDLQAKLLRVLQEKEFRPVGANHVRRSDFRVISATNRNLAAEVEKGTFRQDLYFRLNVITLRLPPLRTRVEDIPDLVEHFLRRYGRGHVMSSEAMQVLHSYEWPGNVRQLEHCIQHMVAVNSGPVLNPQDLPTMLVNHVHQQVTLDQRQTDVLAFAKAVNQSPGGMFNPSPIVPLPELEKRAIIDALRYTKGDRTMAASLLGIGRTTLYRKLKDYGVDAPDLQ